MDKFVVSWCVQPINECSVHTTNTSLPCAIVVVAIESSWLLCLIDVVCSGPHIVISLRLAQKPTPLCPIDLNERDILRVFHY